MSNLDILGTPEAPTFGVDSFGYEILFAKRLNLLAEVLDEGPIT